MTDDLRTRIIKAIGSEVYGDIGNSDLSLATRAADAVIRELGHQCRHCDCPCPCCGNLLTSPRWKDDDD